MLNNPFSLWPVSVDLSFDLGDICFLLSIVYLFSSSLFPGYSINLNSVLSSLILIISIFLYIDVATCIFSSHLLCSFPSVSL